MLKKYEKSSGWIVYRIGDSWEKEILLLKWLNSRKKEEYVIPKWHIEQDEIAKEAAIREICEEAGLLERDLEVIKFITKLNYTFTAGYLKDNPVIDKDVYIFLVKYTGKKKPYVSRDERFIGFKWVPIDKIGDMKVRFDIGTMVKKNRTYFI